MSLADQQWCPTSVQVTVLQARGLRIKGKSGTNDAYAVMQVAKEKYQTSVVEKSVAPVWKEEAAFDLHQGGGGERSTLHVHVLHRALVGPDKLLGQAVINLLQLSEDKTRNKTEWFKLLDKTGKSDKDRGEVLVDIQFMRNNMTASMFDISAAGKSRSRLGKFKDKVRGKKKESDAASSMVPSFTQVLTDSEDEANGEAEVAAGKDEKKKKLKMKSLFSPKSNLQKNMSQSMSVLPGKNSSLSGSLSSGLNVDSSEGKKKFKFMIHKRSGSSDSKDSSAAQQKHGSGEQSNLCINGSHVYCEEPPPRTARIGSNFSLASSGHGSMEDVPENSPPSVDSLRTVRQYSPWTEEEEEEEAEVENKKKDMEEMRIKEEKEMVRRQTLERLAEEKRRKEEEERKQIEEKKLRREEERAKEEERVKREEDERERLAEEKRRLEEQERRRIEEEKICREEEEKAQEEKRRKEKEEEERVRRQEEELERKRIEEEKARKEEEERIRMEEERAQEERKRRKEKEEEEERMRRQEEERERLAEEKRRREEEERKRIEEEKARKEEEERIRMEEERAQEERRRRKEKEEEEERMRRQEEERERLAEEERKRIEEEKARKEEEERIRMEEERAQEERRRRKEKEEEEERMRTRQEEERERLAEEKRRQEEEERKRIEEEKARKEEEERIRMEEERAQEERRRKEKEEEEERMRRQEEERERLAEEKRRQEEEERKGIEEEKARKEEEERIRMEEEKHERLAVEKRRLEEQEKRRVEEEKIRREEEERIRMEEERAQEERRRKEKEEEEEIIRRQEELERLAEKRRQEEEERKHIEEEKARKEEEEMIRMEEERAQEEMRRRKEKEEEEERVRRQEEEERKRIEEEKARREEEEQIRREEEKAQEERVRRQEEEREKLAAEKRRQEEERKRIEEEKARKEEEEMIRRERAQEEKRRQEEEREKKRRQEEEERIRKEERVRKEKEEIERLAEEKRREEQEKRRIKEEEKTKREEEGLTGVSEEQDKREHQRKDGHRAMESQSPSEVTSTNPFEENISNNPFDESPDSPAEPNSNTIQQRYQFPEPSVGSSAISTDEKAVITTQQEKRQAPLPPGRNQTKRRSNKEPDASTQHLAQINKLSKEKNVKTASILPQRSLPLGRPSTDTKNNQSLTLKSANKGTTTTTTAKHTKRPAPTRPGSVEEKPLSEPKTSNGCVSEAKQVPVVYGLNPFDDDEDENELTAQDDKTASGNTSSVVWPPAVSQTHNKDDISQTKKSSKVARAPLPPEKTATTSCTLNKQNTDGAHDKTHVTVPDKNATQTCDPEPEAIHSSRVKESPLQDSQPVTVLRAGEEASEKKEGPHASSRRLQPVKPLNPLEQQSVSGEKDPKSTGIPCEVEENTKVSSTVVKGPFSQLTQEELISLVLKQEKQLLERDSKISELECYIDNLIVRVIEEKPSILMSLNAVKKTV